MTKTSESAEPPTVALLAVDRKDAAHIDLACSGSLS
jgi:hypothetical protein